MTLDARSIRNIVNFLLPFMNTDHERTSLYTLAFGPDHPLLYQLNLNTSSLEALTSLIQRTLAYGEIRPGIPALWALLEVLRQQVGLDKQVEIDQFRALLGLPPTALPDRVFVIYSRRNEGFARRIELDLQDAGLKVWFDRFKIRGGDEWRQSIQRGIERADFVVFCMSPDSVTSDACHWELDVAYQQGKLIIPIMLIECLHFLSEPAQQAIAWLKERHILNFTQSYEYGRHFKELLAALPGYNPPDNYYEDTLDTRQIPNPFRGLEAFRELDYHYFAGREMAVADLVQRVQDPTRPRLLAVIGASGSGKSSLVRAGLVPTLRDVPSLQWETAVFKPGIQPLLALAERLELRFGYPAAELREKFFQQPSSLHDLVKATLSGEPNEARFLLVVDQCEEIFAPAADQERQAFLDVLLSAVAVPHGSLHVVLTLRADFFSHLSGYPELASLIEENLFIATAMTLEQLRRCIQLPAQKVGLAYEAGLVEQILEAVREQPGALPLLQYALKELYERRRGRMLTAQAYSEIGEVQGALATRAEAIFHNLSPSQQEGMRRLLLQLVEVGKEAVTRRRMRLSAMQLKDVTENDLRAIADVLTAEQARLLVASASVSDDLSNEAEIDLEVSHEALLTHWKRLATWIANDHDDLHQGSEYLHLAQAWHIAGRMETSYLLTGRRLDIAQDWLTRADAIALQREFIEASVIYQAQEIARLKQLTQEAEEATQRAILATEKAEKSERDANSASQKAEEATRESERASKRAIRNRTAAFVVGIAAFLFSVVASLIGTNAVNEANAAGTQMANLRTTSIPATLNVVAAQGEQRVQEGENRIESQRLGLVAQNILRERAGNTEVAALLGIRALKTAYTILGDDALTRATDNLFIKNRFQEHTVWVTSVAFAPDGLKALSSSLANTFTLWDIKTGSSLQTFSGHKGSVYSVAFAPDGLTAISGSQDKKLILWDIVTGEPLRTFSDHSDAVTSVAFAPDGQTILSGSRDRKLMLWDVTTGQLLRTFSGHANPITSVAFAPDGRTALSGSRDKTLILWDIATGEPLQTFSGHESSVYSVAFAPDGQHVLSGSLDKTLILWDVTTGQALRTFSGHTDAVTSVVFAPDGLTALSGSQDKTLILWDIATGEPLQTFSGHTDAVTTVAFAPDGLTALSGSRDKMLILWSNADRSFRDVSGSPSRRSFSGHTDAVTSAAFTPDGVTALSGSNDTTLILWDIVTGQALRTFSGHISAVTSVAVAPDGVTALSGSNDTTLILWDIVTGQALRTFSGHISAVTSVAFAPDGVTALSSSNDTTIILWDIIKGQRLRTFSGHTDAVTRVAYSPDGRTAVSASKDKTLILWDIATSQALRIFYGHKSTVYSVAFAPDGQHILSASLDKTLILWDIATSQALRTFSGHTDAVTSVAFSPDGLTAFSASLDNTLILWDIDTGQALRTFSGHPDTVTSIAFAPDGLYILVSYRDTTLQLWNTSYRDLISYACTRVFRDFTDSERVLYAISDLEATCPQFVNQDHLLMTPFPATSTPVATRTPIMLTWTPIASPTLILPTPFAVAQGIIRHSTDDNSVGIYELGASLTLADLGVDVILTNPYAPERSPWDYGLFFRDNGTEEYRLVLLSTGNWELKQVQNGEFTTVSDGQLSNFDTREGSSNRLQFEAKGAQGSLYVNEQFVAELDLSANTSPGKVYLGTGFYTGSSIPGETTRFENLSVYALRQFSDSMLIPTQTPIPSSTPYAMSQGNIPHGTADGSVATYNPDLTLANFVVDVTFFNPYAPENASWDYGVFFRAHGTEQYRLILLSSREWRLERWENGDSTTVQQGSLEDFDTRFGQSNRLRLEVQGPQGTLYVNYRRIRDTLDLSANTTAGQVYLGTGFYTGSSIPGKTTYFTDLSIFELSPSSVVTPLP